MEKDVTKKSCLSDNKRYADLINGVLCNGKQLMHAKDLTDMDSQTGIWSKTFLRGRWQRRPKYRDLIKKAAAIRKKLQNTDVFRTDLKQIFDFIRCSEDKKKLKKLLQSDPAYQEMDEDAYDMAVAYADAGELMAVKKYHGKDGKVNMCKAIQEMLEDERQEGLQAGRQEGLQVGRQEGLQEGLQINCTL